MKITDRQLHFERIVVHIQVHLECLILLVLDHGHPDVDHGGQRR